MFSRSSNLCFGTLPWFLLFQSMVLGMLDAIPNTDCDMVTTSTYNHTINSLSPRCFTILTSPGIQSRISDKVFFLSSLIGRHIRFDTEQLSEWSLTEKLSEDVHQDDRCDA